MGKISEKRSKELASPTQYTIHMSSMTKPLMLLLLLLQIQYLKVYSLLASAGGGYTNHTTGLAVPCSPDQASALLRLKRSFSTTSESITAFRSWRAGTDCCHWRGIRCSDADGCVTSLDLGGRGLHSEGINHALFDLTSLEYLNLAYNDFNGSHLPSSGFERLIKLTHLNLSSSRFDGQVPNGIHHLLNLVSIDLSIGFEVMYMIPAGVRTSKDSDSNDLRLTEPNFEALIENLRNLRELHLGWVDLSASGMQWCNLLAKFSTKLHILSLPFCELSGPICTSISSLHSLAIIDLQHNYISGPIPDFLTNFSNLRVLKLQHNYLEGWVSPAIFEHNKLVIINLYHNLALSGYLLNFSTSSSLETLVVGRTNFTGTIPTSIINLKSLKWLGLSARGFSGELPSSIGKLKSLDVLEISGRGLEGSIPSWITNLTSLTTLEFSYCGLSGMIPYIGNLRKLRKLVLCECKFSGHIPSYVSNLTQLQVVSLYSSNLVGTIELTSFIKLPQLIALDLSDNNLFVVDGEDNSSLESLPKIEYLSLSDCHMSEFPNFLRHQDKIHWLDLSNNQIHGAIPPWAWETWNYFFILDLSNNNFTSIGYGPLLPLNIKVFDLNNNMFEGPIPIPQGSVIWLDYSSNRFSSIPSNHNSHLSHVTVLMASKNNFSGNIPSSFCGVWSIEILDLSYNNFSGSIPPCLMENINGMQSLNLKGNQLHGEIPDNINEGCSFEALDFSGNWIEGQLPRSLVSCKNLEVLDVGNNQITDSFPCWMSTLHRLEVLILKSNKFVGNVARPLGEEKEACSFPSARIVDISSNNFSGTLPQYQWLKKLKSMIYRDTNTPLVMDHGVPQITETYKYTIAITYKGRDTTFAQILRELVFIDFSDNAFHGCIPEAIGDLVLLHGLNLSRNLLTGPIPSQFGRLNQLEALDLSSNELLGVIPHELASMDFLTTLNLSDNKLEGKIPESPHFSTFSNGSFLGNDGLCGLPLTKECMNGTPPNVVPRPSEEKFVDIILFIFAGLGYGIGFAIDIVVTWGIPHKKECGGRLTS